MHFISALFPNPHTILPQSCLVYGDPIAGGRMCKHNLLQLECGATPLLHRRPAAHWKVGHDGVHR